jgi:hypothetical protein
MSRPCSASLLALAAAAFLATAGSASAKTTWLCSPQQSGDPCDYALTSTVVKPDGARSTQTAKAARHLGDVNLALGNLTTIARKQIAAYLKRS